MFDGLSNKTTSSGDQNDSFRHEDRTRFTGIGRPKEFPLGLFGDYKGALINHVACIKPTGTLLCRVRAVRDIVSKTFHPITLLLTIHYYIFTSFNPGKDMNSMKIAEDVYALAESGHHLAPLVKEALEVIDQCLDTHG